MRMTRGRNSLSDSLVQFLIGTGIGIFGGYLANRAYQSSTMREKRQWANGRIIHHGALGCITAVIGATSRSPFVTGIGTGLILTDLKDANEWFPDSRKKVRH